MVKQAVRMGLLPRMEILHTSESQVGQIYLPKVNTILAAGVVFLLLVATALIPQLIGHSSLNFALRYFPASYVGIAAQLEPVLSAIVAFRPEFEAYIHKNPNATVRPQMKVVYPYL
mgnify:CR=1 FL=1